MKNNNSRKIKWVFLLGGLIGVSFALLSLPYSGRKTRKRISRARRWVTNSTVNLIEGTINDANEFAEDLNKKA